MLYRQFNDGAILRTVESIRENAIVDKIHGHCAIGSDGVRRYRAAIERAAAISADRCFIT